MGRGAFKMCNFSFSLFPWFLLALLISFHLSLFLSLSMLPEQRVLQRDQAGFAYWKQMADQRQEGHGFMKRAPNMPGSCRGAWPWMTAARCEREFKWAFCAWLSFFFFWSSLQPCTPVDTVHQRWDGFEAPYSWCPASVWNCKSKAGAWDPSNLGKAVVCLIILYKSVITSCIGITKWSKHKKKSKK